MLIGAAAKLREAEIALADLLPGGDAEAGRYEIADLRAIGEIIYQLVRRRELADSADWTGDHGQPTRHRLQPCD